MTPLVASRLPSAEAVRLEVFGQGGQVRVSAKQGICHRAMRPGPAAVEPTTSTRS